MVRRIFEQLRAELGYRGGYAFAKLHLLKRRILRLEP